MLTASRPLTSAMNVLADGPPLREYMMFSPGVKLEEIVPMTDVPNPETSGLTAM